jgi:hypothetical protein
MKQNPQTFDRLNKYLQTISANSLPVRLVPFSKQVFSVGQQKEVKVILLYWN